MHLKPVLRQFLWPFLLLFLFSSCRTISSGNAELNIPPSVVYFSFDDGPDEHTTPLLLNVLKKHQIRAMFFLLGENAEQYPELVRQIHNDGHYIANHGYSDKRAYRMSNKEFRDELIRGEKAINTALGFNMNPKIYRPHYGFYKPRHERIWVSEGYALIPATIRVYDAAASAGKRADVVRRVIGKAEKRNGGLVLFHDARGSYSNKEEKLKKNPGGPFDRSWIPEAVEEIINILLEKGFVLNNFQEP